MSDPILNRRGYIEVSVEAAKASPSILLRVQSRMAVTNTSLNYATDTFKFYGYSPQFDEVDSYAQSPRYDYELSASNLVTYTRRT